MPVDRPLLIGETNPYGSIAYYALFPKPKGSAGYNLCHKVLGLTDRDYLYKFTRINLCDDGWDLGRAKDHVLKIRAERQGPYILLGAKVCLAFGMPFSPFTVQTSLFATGVNVDMYILPHPSGRSRLWNDPGSIKKARELLKEYLQC